MATVDKLVRAGMWPAMAAMVEGDYLGAQTALGSTQATAALLVADITTLTTVGASTGVVLRGMAGRQIVLNAQGVNALTVYPPVGGQINVLGINTGYGVAVSKAAEFISADGITFIALTSA